MTFGHENDLLHSEGLTTRAPESWEGSGIMFSDGIIS